MRKNIKLRLTDQARRRAIPEEIKKGLGTQTKRYADNARLGLLQYSLPSEPSVGPQRQYVRDAMAPLDSRSTEISFEQGARIQAQIERILNSAGITASFEFQGSVPLNIHIEGISDVDLLVLNEKFFIYDNSTGSRLVNGIQAAQIRPNMMNLRQCIESGLTMAFPQAKLESNNKSIKLSGGSLQRHVDVVPAHWFHDQEYQRTKVASDRGVALYPKDGSPYITNFPFRHKKLINDRDASTGGNTKRLIRFLKTLRADSDEKIDLSSFAIAGLVYRFSVSSIANPTGGEDSLVAAAAENLDFWTQNPSEASKLMSPDGTQAILGATSKMSALQKLATEVEQVARDLAQERFSLDYRNRANLTLSTIINKLRRPPGRVSMI